MASSNLKNGESLRLASFSLETAGGLADYAREQARALRAAGVRVDFITSPSVAKANHGLEIDFVPVLAEKPSTSEKRSRLARRLQTMGWILGNMRRLASWVEKEQVKCVLMGAYMEYFAPLWAPQFRRLARGGVVFGAVVHDPVRQSGFGPRWWRRESVAQAYSFLSEAFVHDPIELDTVRPVKGLQTTVIPHGPYQFPHAVLSREVVRQQLQIPANGQLMLAFGHLRDAKNLDLVLRAMALNPNYYLLVAGKELSSSQRPASYYQELAVRLKVADRCRWKICLVPENEIGDLFEASDVVLLTYNGGFRSASGVLNVAVQYRKPCLASGGAGNLKTSVAKYGLGRWIEPDDEGALAQGMSNWAGDQLKPDWAGYERDNSWELNARLVQQCFLARCGGADDSSAAGHLPLVSRRAGDERAVGIYEGADV